MLEPPISPTSLAPLEGGWSGETFWAEVAGERSVVRIYAGRSAERGPVAALVDAAVLALVRPVLPVPRVLEARRADPARAVPGLLVCSWEPGERLEEVLPGLDAEGWARLGAGLGTLLGRLGLALQPRAGVFADASLRVKEDLPGLSEWVAQHEPRLPAECREGLADLVDAAEDLLAEDSRRVLVHGDLNPKNLLVDPGTLDLTAVLDWEFAHAGGPWEDLGNLLRHLPQEPRSTALLRALRTAYAAMVPAVPSDVLARAEAADLAALVELAARTDPTPPVRLARERLRKALEGPCLGWTWRDVDA